MFAVRFLLVLSLVSIALSSPLFNNLVVHEQREGVPDGFVQNGAAPDDQVLNLRMALVQGDMAGLEQKLFAVSTPGSAQFGQHLSKEEVSALTPSMSLTAYLWTDCV